MKISFTLIFVVALQVSANTIAQNITISLKDAPLISAFREIEKQSSTQFFYNDKLLRGAKKVTVNVRDVSLKQALDEVFKNQTLSYELIDKIIVVKERPVKKLNSEKGGYSTKSFRDIKGKVVNEKGQPVEGVTVMVKGSKISTLTNADGDFWLTSIEEEAILTFTHVSMESFEIKIGGKTDLTVQMKTKISSLDEVRVTINTGYQVIPKERVTGSFTVIDNELLNQQVSTSILERLEPIANAVSVDKKASTSVIMIRGNNTIRGNRQPLIIVDNFPYSGDLENINPNDIENITILKDAAAASIWGARAANGVIVITLKKARLNQPLTVSLNTNINLVQKPDLHYLPTISPTNFIDVEQFLFSKGYRFSDTAATSRPAFSPVYEILFKQRRGQLTAAEANAQIDALRTHDIKNDLHKYAYRTALNQQHALNIQGGTKNISWLLAAGNDRNISNSSATYQRNTLRSETSINPVKNLAITTGIYYTQSNNTSGKPGYEEMRSLRLPPYIALADDAGNPLPVPTSFRQTYIDTAGAGKLLDWNNYPLSNYKHAVAKTFIQNISLSSGINYNLTKALSVDVKYLYERQSREYTFLKDVESFEARSIINSFTQLNRTTGQVTYRVPVGAILDKAQNLITSQNFRASFNYSNTWKNNQLYALAGTEIRDVAATGFSNRIYGYNPGILRSGTVDLATAYPSFVTGSNSFIPDGSELSATADRFVSAFANAAFTHNQKYTATISLRRDASNTFGVNTNDKWNFLWSSGLSWDIGKEKFYNWKRVPYLKLRTTYGLSGNVDPAMAAVTTITYLSNSVFTQSPTARFDKFLNPDLRWEKTAMLNIGLDFKTAANRISGSLEYYHKRNNDLYGTAVVDYTNVPANTILRNVASIKGHGFDVELNTININRTFKWQTQVNFNHSTDRVVDYYLTSNQASGNINSGIGYKGIKGKPVYSLFSYRWAGLDPLTGDPRGFNKGLPSSDYVALTNNTVLISDVVYNGPSHPEIFGAVGNTFSWKKLSLTARLTYKFKYFFLRDALNYSSLFSLGNGHAEYSDRWQQPGDELNTNVPSMIYPASSRRDNFYAVSEINVLKGDHIRLQYININYNLAGIVNRWFPIRSLDAFISVNNIGIIWRANKEGIDPEYRSGTLPPSRSTALGLRINF